MSKTSFDAQTISNSLRTAKHQPRKRFGQNFLHDTSVIRQIVDSIRLERDDNLIEIGPGMGALTEPLLAEVDAMTVVELDRDLADSLRIRIGANSHPNFTIIKDNAMHVDYRELYSAERGKLRVVGNLPYNISTPILFICLALQMSFKTCILCYKKKWLSVSPRMSVARPMAVYRSSCSITVIPTIY